MGEKCEENRRERERDPLTSFSHLSPRPITSHFSPLTGWVTM